MSVYLKSFFQLEFFLSLQTEEIGGKIPSLFDLQLGGLGKEHIETSL